MFRKHQTKNSSKSVFDVKKIHPLVMDLNEQEQGSISGGELQRLQEEFGADLATLSALVLPSLLGQVNKAKS